MASAARVDIDRHSKRLGNTVGRNVVMGWSDSAGREDIGIAMFECIERIDDGSFLVAHYPHFFQINAEHAQIFRDVAHVFLLGTAGQDRVADDQERGSWFGSGCDIGCHCFSERARATTKTSETSSECQIPSLAETRVIQSRT
jgi:hypothetical protein